MAKQKIKFMCTAFRDGFQSVYGARVLTPDFIPAVEAARAAGIDYFESGGGARFQSLFFYCQENAFDMMDAFRDAAGPDATLQTLARGVNVVGLDSQPRDIIDLHAKLFKKHGVSAIRNFDALNDVNNLIYSGQAIVDAGLKHEVCVTMMALPPGLKGAHDAAFYIKTVKEIIASGLLFDSICFKDASGTATPATVYDTIKEARKLLPKKTTIHFHTHETAGISIMAYKAALDAGADEIDLSLSPVSGGTSQPDVLTMWQALRGSEYDLDIDVRKIQEAEEVLKECLVDYFLPPEALAVEPLIPWSPMPGGALTANTQMLRDNGIMDKYEAIVENMREVVERGGFGTSVTPVSQFYFQQAFNNTLFTPWEKISDGYGRMILGYYGKTPVAPDAEIVVIAQEKLGLEPTTENVLDLNDKDDSKGVAAAQKLLQEASLEESDENIFIAATCLDKGVAFLQGKGDYAVRKIDTTPTPSPDGEYTVTVDGKSYAVKLNDETAMVNGRTYDTSIVAGLTSAASAPTSSNGEDIKAPMPGKVFKMLVQGGDFVEIGQVVMVLEAMKMENDVQSHVAGMVESVEVGEGDQVYAEDVLVRIK